MPDGTRLFLPVKIIRSLSVAGLLTLLAGCAVQPVVSPPAKPVEQQTAKAQWEPLAWSALDGWQAFDIHAGSTALRQSCKAQARKPVWRELCAELAGFAPGDEVGVRRWLERRFRPYRLRTSDGGDSGLITGYYEPVLQGDRKRSERARYPLYTVPDDMLTVDFSELYPELKGMRLRGRLDGRKVVPYYSRADIDSGRVAGLNGKELAWVEDAVELFFLQIQGSGRVRLPDGGVIRVGYADQNGYPYKAIGKVLIERGELPANRVSMQSIQAWARDNPGKLQEVLDSNPSYVFFRELPASADGPPGAQGVPLTAGGSIAVDPRHIPLGTPVLLSATLPGSDKPLNRLVVAQDTGGAIRGPIRADYFWGLGPEAGRQAGLMKQQGRLWLLWPVDLPLPDGAS